VGELKLMWLSAPLLVLGVFLVFSAAFGLVRLRDPAARLHPPTKASALGLVLIALASALEHGARSESLVNFFLSRELMIAALVILVSPLAGFVLLRAWKFSQKT
jgi:monovalent cation/proton antiporter MnhG/PhaG subunit